MTIRFIFIQPICGLGNRLRALACGYALSQHLGNIPLYVQWRESEDCGVSWKDLFDSQDNLKIKHATLEMLLQEYPNCYPWYEPEKHTEVFFRQSNQHLYDSIMIEGGHDFKHPDMSVADLITFKNEFYQMLFECIKPEIKKKVDDVLNFLKQRCDLIGVHLRAYVPKYDEADMKNDPSWENFENKDLIQTTTSFMKKHNKKNTCFFISSNSVEMTSQLCKSFHNTIKYEDANVESADRDNAKSIIHSFIHMIILSRCKLILGTYKSSFSDEAAIMGNIKKICCTSKDHSQTPYHAYGFSTSSTGEQCVNAK
jgi:hypothetical protein